MDKYINIEEIQEYLPHRYPFLLIDRVVELELGRYIKAYKNITTNEPFFLGHFPGKQVMPGVLILEAMAQASGILGFNFSDSLYKSSIPIFFIAIVLTIFGNQFFLSVNCNIFDKVKSP